MRIRLRQGVIQSAGSLITAGIQIYSGYWQRLFKERVEVLDFNASTLTIALIEIALGIVSGILLSMILFSWMSQIERSAPLRSIFLFSALLPLIALIIRGITALEGFGWLPMSFMPVWNWAIFSPVPPLWLGIAIAALIQRPKIVL